MKKIYEGLTLAQLRTMLEENVDKHNITEDAAERVALNAEGKEIATAYNELSLLTVYADCLKDENPLVAFAKKFYYHTLGTKVVVSNDTVDGVARSVEVCSITESNKQLNMFKFIDWARERNKIIVANKSYKSALNKARDTINQMWKDLKNSKDKSEFSKNAIKKAMQPAFDALAFIPCEKNKDKNAIIANGDTAFYIIALSAKLTITDNEGNPNFDIEFLEAKTWQSRVFEMFHQAVEGKTYTTTFADIAEEVEPDPVVEAEPDKK